MCGRFNVIDNPGLQDLLKDLGIDLSLPPAINVAPTETVSLVRASEAGGCAMDAACWWLTPSWAPAVDQKYSMFNARAESIATSRAFRGPFRRQRGLVPMSSFIEWRFENGVKQPWQISNDAGALAVAALWDVWEKGDAPLLSCTLVTTAAAPAFTDWHKRMPVMLAPDERERWLDNAQVIERDDALFRPELKEDLHLAPLDRAISNARNKDAGQMRAIGDEVVLAA